MKIDIAVHFMVNALFITFLACAIVLLIVATFYLVRGTIEEMRRR